jgi:hypothetical protein
MDETQVLMGFVLLGKPFLNNFFCLIIQQKKLVEATGIEPATSSLQSWRSPN